MKKFILISILILTASSVYAQLSDIAVSYNYRHFNPVGKELNSQMLLLANKEQSKFFNPMNEKVDSMMTTAEGRMAYSQMMQAAMAKKDVSNLPVKKEPLYVLKSNKDSVVSVYDLIGADLWTYNEDLIPQQWSIDDSTKVILGYECIKATCSYRGREWTAWFSPEIPLQDGPWKLCGLPGLILSAEDSTGQYSFTADGIQQKSMPILPIYGLDGYEKIDRIKYLKSMRSFTNNPVAYMSAATGAKMDNMPKIEIDESYDFLETDYR